MDLSYNSTRMHSSRMRTGRSLTVCWWGPPSREGGLLSRASPSGGGVPPSWGVPHSWGVPPSQGGSTSRGSPSGGASFWGGASYRGCASFLGGLLPGGLLPGVPPSGGWYPSMHWGRPPPVDRITDMSKNINLATTSLWPVINVK